MNDLASLLYRAPTAQASDVISPRRAVLMVVESRNGLSAMVEGLCDHLEITVQSVHSSQSLPQLLVSERPVAVLAELDGADRDGCHVMMEVADYDPTLPILLLTGSDPALLGAADAVIELWGLSAVRMEPHLPNAGGLAEFLCSAACSGRCLSALDSETA